MLAVEPDPAAGARSRRRAARARLGEHGFDRVVPGGPKRRRVHPDAGFHHRLFDVVAHEHLSRVAPQSIHGGLHAPVGLLGAVAETHDPRGGVAQVVLGFL